MSDPRSILKRASEKRTVVDFLVKDGGKTSGELISIEHGSVIASLQKMVVTAGSEVKCWLEVAGARFSFEASVIRVGVPIPSRGQNGIMLGYIDEWKTESDDSTLEQLSVEILLPSGPPIQINQRPSRIIHLTMRELSFFLPNSFPMMFAQQASLELRLGDGFQQTKLHAVVDEFSQKDGYVAYTLRFEQVDNRKRLREFVDAFGRVA